MSDIKKIESVLEAVLFTMGESVSVDRLAVAIDHDEETTKRIMHQMMDHYNEEERGMKIIELENAFQLCTRPEMYEALIKVAKQPKRHVLTDVLLETLSIIAYKQPITKAEIEKIRGVKSDHAVNKLVEYNLIMELGRLDAPGKPILFGTTEEFLRNFGVQSIDELPVLDVTKKEEFEHEAEEEVQLRFGSEGGLITAPEETETIEQQEELELSASEESDMLNQNESETTEHEEPELPAFEESDMLNQNESETTEHEEPELPTFEESEVISENIRYGYAEEGEEDL